MNYAIFESGSAQHRVSVGNIVEVDLLELNNPEGEVVFDKVMLLCQEGQIVVGAPYIDGVSIKGQFIREVKGEKVIAFKYTKRHHYRRKVGHRQRYARIEITQIA